MTTVIGQFYFLFPRKRTSEINMFFFYGFQYISPMQKFAPIPGRNNLMGLNKSPQIKIKTEITESNLSSGKIEFS